MKQNYLFHCSHTRVKGWSLAEVETAPSPGAIIKIKTNRAKEREKINKVCRSELFPGADCIVNKKKKKN